MEIQIPAKIAKGIIFLIIVVIMAAKVAKYVHMTKYFHLFLVFYILFGGSVKKSYLCTDFFIKRS